MEKKNNKLFESLSLIDRLDKRVTFTESVDMKNRLIMEAERVGSKTFIEFLTRYDIRKGPFVTVGYIQLYPTSPMYATDDTYNEMDSIKDDFEDDNARSRYEEYMDRVKNTEWSAPTGRKKPGGTERQLGKRLYPYVIKLTNYSLHWQDYDKYKKKSGEKYDELEKLKGQLSQDTLDSVFRRKIAIPSTHGYYPIGDVGNYDILTFGNKGEDGTYTPQGQSYLKDPNDPNSKVEFDRTAVKNYLSDIKAQKPVYFGVDENGDIDPIPKSLGKILYKDSTIDVDSRIASVSDPEQVELLKRYFTLENEINMANKTFLLSNVAYMCGTVKDIDGRQFSAYWVNKNPLFLLEKTVGGEKVKYVVQKINNAQLEGIISRYARSESDELQAMANQNI